MNKLLRIAFVGLLIFPGFFSYSQEMKKYICNGEGKAQGLKFSIDYPNTWIISDGVRPHILKIFDCEDKKGKVSMTIYVNKLDEALSKEQIDYAFQKDFTLDIPAFREAKVIEFKNDLQIEGQRGMLLTIYVKGKVYDLEAYSIFKFNHIYFDRYHIQVNFDIMSYDQKYETMIQMYNRYNIVFKEIMYGLSINSRWSR